MRECRSQATFYVSSISCLETAQRGGPPMPEEAVRGPRARPRKHGMAVLPMAFHSVSSSLKVHFRLRTAHLIENPKMSF